MSGTGSAEPAIIRLRLLQKPRMERVWCPYGIHTHVSDAGASFSRSVYQSPASGQSAQKAKSGLSPERMAWVTKGVL